MSDSNALVKLALAGDRAKKACDRLVEELKGLEAAVKRTLPHLARRKVTVTAIAPRPLLRGELAEITQRPFHVLALDVGAGPHAAGALVLDAKAIAHGMDGMLGSGSGDLPTLDPNGLSVAQIALANRLARSFVPAFDEVLARAGAPLKLVEPGTSGAPEGGVLAACTVKIGEGESEGSVTVLVPVACVATTEKGAVAPAAPMCRETQAALDHVELDVVAELGRVKLPLTRVAGLRVGDVLRLPLSVEAPVRLQVGGRALFSGKPTTRGSQIAVEVTAD